MQIYRARVCVLLTIATFFQKNVNLYYLSTNLSVFNALWHSYCRTILYGIFTEYTQA